MSTASATRSAPNCSSPNGTRLFSARTWAMPPGWRTGPRSGTRHRCPTSGPTRWTADPTARRREWARTGRKIPRNSSCTPWVRRISRRVNAAGKARPDPYRKILSPAGCGIWSISPTHSPKAVMTRARGRARNPCSRCCRCPGPPVERHCGCSFSSPSRTFTPISSAATDRRSGTFSRKRWTGWTAARSWSWDTAWDPSSPTRCWRNSGARCSCW